MEKYIKPSIVRCGTSESVIKGRSGVGSENLWFRKVGSRMTSKFQKIHIQNGLHKVK